MEDARIVELYWSRAESAIAETDAKYGKYCYAIAYRILADAQDADESVNDTWLDAWNAMPPHRPLILSTFLGKITRRLAIDRWRGAHAQKRGGGELLLALEELAESVGGGQDVARRAEDREAIRLLNRFLRELPAAEREVFVCRYWYLASVQQIAAAFDMSESKARTMLFRTRKKLCQALEKEGYGWTPSC